MGSTKSTANTTTCIFILTFCLRIFTLNERGVDIHNNWVEHKTTLYTFVHRLCLYDQNRIASKSVSFIFSYDLCFESLLRTILPNETNTCDIWFWRWLMNSYSHVVPFSNIKQKKIAYIMLYGILWLKMCLVLYVRISLYFRKQSFF